MIIVNLTIVKGGEMEDLIKKIEQWANDRNIIKGSKPIDQAMKLFGEFGELADNVGKGQDCRDDIGDVFVVLTIIAKQVRETSMLTACDKNYQVDTEWREEEQPKSLENLKELVIMLNRDLHCLIMSIDFSNVTDEVKHCVDCLSRIAEINGYSLQECVQIAYNDIKDRKGIMSNGVFIKEDDPAYESIIKAIESNCE